MSSVWLVTTGESSDYSVAGVFATEQIANDVAAHVGGEVEERALYTETPVLWHEAGMWAYRTDTGWCIDEKPVYVFAEFGGSLPRVTVTANPSASLIQGPPPAGFLRAGTRGGVPQGAPGQGCQGQSGGGRAVIHRLWAKIRRWLEVRDDMMDVLGSEDDAGWAEWARKH